MNTKLLLLQREQLAENKGNYGLNHFYSKITELTLFFCLLFVSSLSFSQTGPAGVNAGLRLWLDASDLDGDGIVEGIGENGLVIGADTTVTEWRDKASGLSFTTPTSALFTDSAKYKISNTNFNDRTSIDFGTGSALMHDLTTTWGGAHTIFIVFKQKTSGVPLGTSIFASGIDTIGAATIDDHFRISADTSGMNFSYYTTSAAGTTANENDFGLQSAAAGGVIFYSATRTAGDIVETFVNGTPVSTVTFNADGDSLDQYILNANRDTTLTNDCYIAEVIVYEGVLFPAERARINTYLSCKYSALAAEVGPGGIEHCAVSLWLKADAASTTLTGGDNVITWEDKSSNNYDATGPGGNRPHFFDNGNNFNPHIEFDEGNSESFSLPAAVSQDGLVLGTSDFSIYAVASPTITNSGTLFADRRCIFEAGYRTYFDHTTGNWNFYSALTNNTDLASVDVVNATSTYSLLNFKRYGDVHAGKTHQSALVTDTAAATLLLSSSNYATVPSERWIGREFNCAASDHFFDGDLSELIIIRSTVSAAKDKQIQTYLGLKYGLSLPISYTNYMASDGTTVLWDNTLLYWNDIAGIGQDDGTLLDQRISKSQDPSGIVTIAEFNDFSLPNNDVSRTSLGDQNFLVWGNNNIAATDPWSITGAPANFARLPETWLVKETGTVDSVSIQVEVDNPMNDMPDFVGDLFFIHGTDLSLAVPDTMTETSPGVWSITDIDFGPNDLFTFAVQNRLEVEFTSDGSTTPTETSLGAFTEVVGIGIINVPTYVIVSANPVSANLGADYTFTTDTVETILVPTEYLVTDTFAITPPGLPGDGVSEPNEVVDFELDFTQDGIFLGDVNGDGQPDPDHSLTIQDDDSYSVSIAQATDGVENSVVATFKIFVVGGNASNSAIDGDIDWTSGTAGNTVDFSGPPDFSIPALTDTIWITATSINDGFLEGTETIGATISITSPATGVVTAVDNAFADLVDDEITTAPVSISSPMDAVEAGSISYLISLDNSVINETGTDILGSIAFSGSADYNVDFNGLTTFAIPDGDNAVTVSYFAIPDALVENTETATATITLTNSIGVVNGAMNSATADIFDEDTTGLTISVSAPTGVVENAGPITYTFTLDGSKINGTGAPITGDISYTGTALPADYTSIPSFSIADGDMFGTVDLVLFDDMLTEGTETVTAEISNLSIGDPHPTNDSITVNLLDDESDSLFISIGDPTDSIEMPLPDAPFVSFNVYIVGGGTVATNITGTIDYSSSTATDGADFTSQAMYTIIAGDTGVIIELPIIDNPFTEPEEFVIATLFGSPSLGAYANTSATASIEDDDGASLQIAIDTPANGAEGGDSVSFLVSLVGGATNFTGNAITGVIDLTSGTAEPGIDFIAPLPSIFSIPDGAMSTTITLPVNDDDAVEYNETVVAVISMPSIGSISSSDTAIALIVDNDLPSLSVSLVNPVDGTEGDPVEASFDVLILGSLTNGLGVPLTGTIDFTGSALSGPDFNSNTTFSIAEGDGSVTHTVFIEDDQDIELLDTIFATISFVLEGSISAQNMDTLYINDNDYDAVELIIEKTVDGIEFPIPSSTDAEFMVSISGGLTNQTGIPITGDISFGGTATEGDDYPAGITTFSIADGSDSALISILITDDFLEEPTETIIATISAPTVGVVDPSLSFATATITDDDTDLDNDGLPDILDSNDVNIDMDCDGIFDGCDADHDGDGVIDAGLTDTDGDGIHDDCDASVVIDDIIDNGPDINLDDLNDVEWDPTDNDSDLLPAHVDPDDNNPDFDGDGWPDGADVDVNNDGVFDNGCDSDGDGIHDVADSDDNPSDNITDDGNIDDNQNGIDNAWDPFSLDGGQHTNYIVSPNGDGTNETLRIQGIDFFENHKLMIFDRWGALIYQTVDYTNTWAGEVNEGISITGAEILPDGVYYYVLDLGNNEGSVKGFIELRR